jgi:hypothetical protein
MKLERQELLRGIDLPFALEALDAERLRGVLPRVQLARVRVISPINGWAALSTIQECEAAAINLVQQSLSLRQAWAAYVFVAHDAWQEANRKYVGCG